jgi:lysylphosphatidylglycerol synthetase-like protein (DUF2156 family)
MNKHNEDTIAHSQNRTKLIELVRKWADVNTDGILDKATQIFSVPHIEGLIGYRIELKNAIVYGDPICAPADKLALAKAFESHCKSQNMHVLYVIVSRDFAHLAAEHLAFSSVEFGRKFVLDPLKGNAQTALLRKKVRQSSKNGVTVTEYINQDPLVEQSMEQLAIAWVQARKGIQVYLAEPTLFADRLGKRWFYAAQQGQIVGFALLNELQSHQGWLLNNVMVAKGAPSGVSEHLVVSILETLEKEQCRFVLIGPVPAKQIGETIGLGKAIELFAAWTFKVLRKICRLDGHEIFWEKFQPELKSSYLLFPKKQLRPSSILALLRALNISLR